MKIKIVVLLFMGHSLFIGTLNADTSSLTRINSEIIESHVKSKFKFSDLKAFITSKKINNILHQFNQLKTNEKLLAALLPIILFSVFLALGFLSLAIFFWFLNRNQAARVSRFRKEWQDIIFDRITKIDNNNALPFRFPSSEIPLLMDFLLEMSHRFKGDALKPLIAIAEPFLQSMVKSCRSSDEHTRAHAVRAIATFGMDKYPEIITRALGDKSLSIRMIAFRGLILHGRLEFIDLILLSLQAFHKWNRNLLASLLSSLGSPACVKLRGHFADPKTPVHVKAVLAVALKQLNDPKSVPIAESILLTENDQNVAAECLRLLGSLGTSGHLPHIRALCTSMDPVIRAQAVSALGKIGKSDDVSIMETAFNDPDSWVALHAAMGYKELGALTALENIAKSGHPRRDLARQVLLEKST